MLLGHRAHPVQSRQLTLRFTDLRISSISVIARSYALGTE
jgi:hypothetical protein